MRLLIVGGSDAGISAALRARELDPASTVDVVLADAYPNFSICGIPYYVSGDVGDWHDLAHRSVAELEATGMTLHLDTTALEIDAREHRVRVADSTGAERLIGYDRLIVGTGAHPVRPPIDGLDSPGVHVLHTMGDTFALMRTLEERATRTAMIVGAGYIGIELAEALTARGLAVTQIEQLPEVLPTVDAELGALVHQELEAKGVEVLTGTAVTHVSVGSDADVVAVVVGVRPDTELAVSAGAATGARGAIAVDRQMRTTVPDVFAAGDCVVTHHRLLGESYLPLGTTAHKQGRIAGENALGGTREFAGSLGTQVVKVFDQVVARTGLRDHEAVAAGFDPLTVATVHDDHKRYYPGSRRVHVRVTGDRASGLLLGVQLFGHRHSEIAKRIDTAAAAIFAGLSVDALNDLDLSYTPPLGSPWDALQAAGQAWSAISPTCAP